MSGLVFVMILADMIADEGVSVRVGVFADWFAHAASAGLSQAHFHLLLHYFKFFTSLGVVGRISCNELHSDSDKAKILVFGLKPQHVTDHFLFHDVLHIDCYCRFNRKGGYLQRSLVWGKYQLSVYRLMFGSSSHDVFFLRLLALLLGQLSDFKSGDSKY